MTQVDLSWTPKNPEHFFAMRSVCGSGTDREMSEKIPGATLNGIIGYRQRHDIPVVKAASKPWSSPLKFFWPPACVEHGEAMLAATDSFQALAVRLGGQVTRNVISGWCYRNGVKGVNSPPDMRPKSQAPKTRKRQQPQTVMAEQVSPPSVPRHRPYSLTKWCQFIEGEPTVHESCKCLEPVRAGSSYCQHHHERCLIRHKNWVAEKVNSKRGVLAASATIGGSVVL